MKERGCADQAEALAPEIRQRWEEYTQCQASLTQDPDFRRMRFVRYADDFVISIIGDKEDARRVLADLHSFMTQTLKVELAAEKTGIVHGSEGTRFLGYDVRLATNPHRVVRTRGGRRRPLLVGTVTLEWPMELATKFAWERGYINDIQERRTRPRTPLLNLNEEEIVRRYVQELRGVANYYSRARNWKHVGNHLHWLCKSSLVKTLRVQGQN